MRKLGNTSVFITRQQEDDKELIHDCLSAVAYSLRNGLLINEIVSGMHMKL